MATLRITLGGTAFYPLLPIESEDIAIEEVQRMASGTLRRWQRGIKHRVTLTFAELTESNRTALITAAPLNASVTYVDEHLVSRTMQVLERSFALERTRPVTEGGTNTTGDAFYGATVVLEEV